MAQIRDRHEDRPAVPGPAPKEEPLVLGLAHRQRHNLGRIARMGLVLCSNLDRGKAEIGIVLLGRLGTPAAAGRQAMALST
jgi:hypothetical protein